MFLLVSREKEVKEGSHGEFMDSKEPSVMLKLLLVGTYCYIEPAVSWNLSFRTYCYIEPVVIW